MKTRQMLLFAFIVAFLSIAASTLIYTFYIIDGIQKIPIEINVSDRLGFNLDPGAIRFGMLTPGNSARRNIQILNNKDYPTEIRISIQGAYVADWTKMDESNERFVLQPMEQRQVEFTMAVPRGTPHGGYTGVLQIVSKRMTIFS